MARYVAGSQQATTDALCRPCQRRPRQAASAPADERASSQSRSRPGRQRTCRLGGDRHARHAHTGVRLSSESPTSIRDAALDCSVGAAEVRSHGPRPVPHSAIDLMSSSSVESDAVALFPGFLCRQQRKPAQEGQSKAGRRGTPRADHKRTATPAVVVCYLRTRAPGPASAVRRDRRRLASSQMVKRGPGEHCADLQCEDQRMAGDDTTVGRCSKFCRYIEIIWPTDRIGE